MGNSSGKHWRVYGYSAILVGCFFIAVGIASWRDMLDLVDGIVFGTLILVAAAVIVGKRARRERVVPAKDLDAG